MKFNVIYYILIRYNTFGVDNELGITLSLED